MRKRNLLAGLMAAGMVFGSLTGCGNTSDGGTEAAKATEIQTTAEKEETKEITSEEAADESADKSMKIVTTIFPEYDWVKTILGDKADNSELTLLLDNGVDLHSYQPTAEDMVKIQECDMFIYVGGESDEWVEDVLGSSQKNDMVVINLLDVLGDAVKDEEIVEGMEHEHEHEDEEHEHEDEEHEHEDEEHEHEDEEHEHEDEEHEHEEEKDEHVWLSLRNASVLCEEIAAQLGNIDEANKDFYISNYEAYKTELDNLDEEYKTAVGAGNQKTLLFGDRFPFRYLVDDYGIDYYAAFAGCSAESEASFETVVFLSGKVDELGLPAIMTIEGPDHKIAETVRNNTTSKDQQILTMDSMQATTSKDIADGVTYLSVMRNNLEVLKEALK
ncbi:MAG: zinc ABC transporter substrate-binding protein [Eubacterium sp.]|nr:zinc ABC transporter substrate-binding protein [Eubacterium sp.]